MARHREDHPEKYVELRSAWLRGGGRIPAARPGSETVEAMLRWALERGLPGFGEDDVIGIAAASEGFQARKPVVSEALLSLARKGFVEAVPNSPYRIINLRSVLPDRPFRMDYTFSMTRALPDVADHIVVSGRVPPGQGLEASTWFSRDDASRLARLQEGARGPETAALPRPGFHMVRARTLPGSGGRRHLALLECIAFFLPGASIPILEAELAGARSRSPLVELLGRCGITDLVTGATLLTVAPLPPPVGMVAGRLEALGISAGRLGEAGREHLEELYLLYSPACGGAVAAVACHVNTDLIQLLVRDFSVLPAGTEPVP